MIDVRRIKIGDRIPLKPYPYVQESGINYGIVVYIHPKRRFFTLEFTSSTGKIIHESFIPYGKSISSKD